MCVALRKRGEPEPWHDVCALDEIVPDSGVCALVNGRQLALVRVGDGEQVFAIDNFDPFARAFVISRGLVVDKNGAPAIASPIFKHAFDLRSGRCLDDATVRLPTWPARVRDGRVLVFAG